MKNHFSPWWRSWKKKGQVCTTHGMDKTSAFQFVARRCRLVKERNARKSNALNSPTQIEFRYEVSALVHMSLVS